MAKQDPDEVEKRLRREAAEQALEEAAERDPGVAKWLDDDLERGFEEILGMNSKDLQKALSASIEGLTSAELDQALEDARRARKALEGGWFSKGDRKRAEKILMSNGKIKELGKKRGEKSCFIAGLLLVAFFGSAFAGVIWGAVEIVSAVGG